MKRKPKDYVDMELSIHTPHDPAVVARSVQRWLQQAMGLPIEAVEVHVVEHSGECSALRCGEGDHEQPVVRTQTDPGVGGRW